MEKEIEVEEIVEMDELELVYAWCGIIGCGGQISTIKGN